MTLTRGARITGAVLCAVLAVIAGAWIARDFAVSDGPADFWRDWSSDPRRSWGRAPQVTSPLDGALFAVYAAGTVAVLRSSVAASTLAVTAVLTLAVRLPSLWVLTGSWAYLRPVDSLRTRALLTTFAVLGLALGLVITAVAGRRPPDGGRGHGPHAEPHRRTPTRPTRAVAWLAGALLVLESVLTAAWQIRFGYQVGAEAYLDSLVGGELTAQRMLAPPSGWLAGTMVVLGLVAGTGLLAGAVFARPLGAVLAVTVTVTGAVGVDFAYRWRVFENLADLPLEYRLSTTTSVFELVAGLVLLVLLLRRGHVDGADDGAADGYGPSAGHGPAHLRPPGPGRRSQGRPSGYGRAIGGSPPGGGHGPPPPSSRPPNW